MASRKKEILILFIKRVLNISAPKALRGGLSVSILLLGVSITTPVYTPCSAAPGSLPTYGSRELIFAFANSRGPNLMTPADFNGDTFQDLGIIRFYDFSGPASTSPPIFLLNNTKSNLTLASTALFTNDRPKTQWPRESVVADFNNDGRPDLFIADHGHDFEPFPGFQNALVLSSGATKLRTATKNLPQQKDYTHSACGGDLDNDGDIDLVLGNHAYMQANIPPMVLLNNGVGKFSAGTPLPFPQNFDYSSCHIADIDNNGTNDIIFGGWGYQNLFPSDVMLNNGSAQFTLLPGAMPKKRFGMFADVLDIQSADLNGDGFVDLVAAETNDYKGWAIQVLINNGDGSFRDETLRRLNQASKGLATDWWIMFIELADINGDGHVDIFPHWWKGSAAAQNKPAYVYVNNGAGFFKPLPANFVKWFQPFFALIDIDGDGGRDVITTDYGGAEYYLIRDTGPVIKPGIPTGVNASKRIKSKVQLSWNYVWGATSYEIVRSENIPSTGKVIGTTRFTGFADTFATPGQAFYYSIRAVNSAGKGKSSAPVMGRKSP